MNQPSGAQLMREVLQERFEWLVASLKEDLTWRRFDGLEITDLGLESIKDLTTLNHLELGRTQVTNSGLKHLSNLQKPTQLTLYETGISDAGFKELAKLKNLKFLHIGATNWSKDAVKEFQKQLPDCFIRY